MKYILAIMLSIVMLSSSAIVKEERVEVNGYEFVVLTEQTGEMVILYNNTMLYSGFEQNGINKFFSIFRTDDFTSINVNGEVFILNMPQYTDEETLHDYEWAGEQGQIRWFYQVYYN